MRRPWNGAMPVTLTLPVGLHRRPRVRQRRLRRLALGALLALAVALLAAPGTARPTATPPRNLGRGPTRIPSRGSRCRAATSR